VAAETVVALWACARSLVIASIEPANHATFSELSPAVDPTVMQGASGVLNVRVVSNPINRRKLAVNTLTNRQFSLTKSPAVDPVASEQSPVGRAGAQAAFSKRLEVAAVIEIAFAFAGVFVLLAIGAAIWHSASFDWFDSIRRFQEMI
jgi:hypothetical protein